MGTVSKEDISDNFSALIEDTQLHQEFSLISCFI